MHPLPINDLRSSWLQKALIEAEEASADGMMLR
jgi:hypothetical protein